MMKIVCALLLVALANAAPPPTCLPGVESGKCYKLYEKEDGGYDCIGAQEYCTNKQGALAVFETQQDYDNVFFALLSKKPGTMILTGMKYKPGLSKDRPSVKIGGKYTPVGYTPDWFENHPIQAKSHTEMIMIASKSSKFSGMMNTEDGCRYNLILCEE